MSGKPDSCARPGHRARVKLMPFKLHRPFGMVDSTEWGLDGMRDDRRREHLLNPPPAENLIALLTRDAMHSAERGNISPGFLPDGREMKGCFRATAAIPVCRETFDLLFNGRSGYRAQYYLSASLGGLFNRLVVASLLAPLQQAYRGHDREQDAIRSLIGPWSKIWPTGDKAYFDEARKGEFQPRRWTGRISVWLRAPCPDAPSIDVIGTWVGAADRRFKLDLSKKKRDLDLYERGGA